LRRKLLNLKVLALLVWVGLWLRDLIVVRIYHDLELPRGFATLVMFVVFIVTIGI